MAGATGVRRGAALVEPPPGYATGAQISHPVAGLGALTGSWSHVPPDSVMHADMRPLAPFSDANALLYVISIDALHLLCVGLGVAGVVLVVARVRRVGR